MPHWSRLTCLFGLPDDADETDDVVLAAIGPVIRAAAADIVEAELPPELVALLAQLNQQRPPVARQRRRSMARQQAPAGHGRAADLTVQRRRAEPRSDLVVAVAGSRLMDDHDSRSLGPPLAVGHGMAP